MGKNTNGAVSDPIYFVRNQRRQFVLDHCQIISDIRQHVTSFGSARGNWGAHISIRGSKGSL